MDDVFTAEGAWSLTHYELLVELGASSDSRASRALELLWGHPALEGPYAEQAREPREQSPVDPSALLEMERRLPGLSYGVLALTDGPRVACGAFVLRRPAGDEKDWLSFYVPLGSLVRVWPEVAPYPFLDREEDMAQHVEWQERIEARVVDIARHVFGGLPFELAVIGHELEWDAEDFQRWERSKSDTPDERSEGLLVAREGELIWYPPTRRAGWILVTDGLGNPSTWSELFASSDDDASS